MAMTFSFSSSGVLVILSADALIQLGGGRLWLLLQILHEIINCPGLCPPLDSAGDISHNSRATSAAQQFLSNQLEARQRRQHSNKTSSPCMALSVTIKVGKNDFTLLTLRGRDEMVPLDCQ